MSCRQCCFSLISKPHYRKPMRAIRLNASAAIYWKCLCSYMLTSNHRPHSRRFYFLLGNNHVARRPHCCRCRLPFLQFPVTCIDIGASLFRFRSHNGRESRVTSPYTRSNCAWSPSPRHETAHVKTLRIPLYNGKTSSVSLDVTWKDRIY